MTLEITKVKITTTIPGMLKNVGLDKILPEDNIIYSNFYDKKILHLDLSQPSLASADLTSDNSVYYYEHTSASKKTKIPDFEAYCHSRSINKANVLILDDRDDVWQQTESESEEMKPVAHLLSVDNSQSKRSVKRYLTQILTQCILYGEHIPLPQRQAAAQTYLTLAEHVDLNQKSVFDFKTFLTNTSEVKPAHHLK